MSLSITRIRNAVCTDQGDLKNFQNISKYNKLHSTKYTVVE